MTDLIKRLPAKAREYEPTETLQLLLVEAISSLRTMRTALERISKLPDDGFTGDDAQAIAAEALRDSE